MSRAREADRANAVVVKTVRSEPHDAESVAALQHEYSVLQRFDVPGIVRAIALREMLDGPALVLEDAGTATLQDQLHGPLPIDEFLRVACRLAEILEQVHARNVIHLDINPANVVIGPDGAPTLIDFDSATTSPHPPTALLPELDGALPYLAPEQTGRMNRLVDHRSDLYSLGALFYEMLTGAPPFRADDPLEVVHAHLTKVPISPSVVAPRVPPLLSGIVLKLLAKMPDERYQSAAALAADLREAARRLQTTGRVDPFELGNLDLALQLPLPERLYGREQELAELRHYVDRAAAGAREFVLVVGDAGIGKSSLVRAIKDHVTAKGGRFLMGKRDVRAANEPYSALREALGQLVDDLLEQPEPLRRGARARILDAVGDRGSVITELVPELEELVGEQPPLSRLGPVEAKMRFQSTLYAFLQSFASEGHPLALFLDDLQWADAATVEALRSLACNQEGRCLVFLTALRPKEPGAKITFKHLERDLAHALTSVQRIDLGPLRGAAVRDFVADALRCTPEDADPLAQLLARKTAGNPFFLRQLLRSLQKSALIRFDVQEARWKWDIAAIDKVGVTENVLELLLDAIRGLPDSTRQLLPRAACVGKLVELGVLTRIVGRSADDVVTELQPALREGLLRAEPADAALGGIAYEFAHDRVQDAAYSLLTENEQRALHWEIGRDWLASSADIGADSRLFEIADQLNLGSSVVTTIEDKLELARLNRHAGTKAMESSAYGSALAYLRAGIAQLPSDAWHTHHELALSLHREAAECAYVTGEYAVSDALVDTGLAHSDTPIERADLHNLRVISETARAAWAPALRHGWAALAELGVEPVPKAEYVARIAEERRAVDALSAVRPPEKLRSARLITDPQRQVTLRLLVNLQHVAWFVDRDLFELLTLRALRFIQDHGVTAEAVTAFGDYAICLSAQNKFTLADAFTKLAQELAEQLGDKAQLAHAVLVDSAFVRPWLSPYASALPQIAAAIEAAKQVSEIRAAAYGISLQTTVAFAAGRDLDELLQRIESDMPFLQATRNEAMIAIHQSYRQAIRCLKGLTYERNRFDEDGFEERSFLSRSVPPTKCFYEVRRLQTSFILRDFGEASVRAETAGALLPTVAGHIPAAEYNFYSSLSYAALCEAAAETQRAEWLSKIEANQRRLSAWATTCPENFRHRYQLVSAEVARLEDKHLEATDLYEQALEGAARSGFVQEDAIASELAARHALSCGRGQIAELYMERARERYARWGASEKVRALEEEFTDLSRSQAAMTARVHGSDLDLHSLLRAAETVSTEVVLDHLLEKLIRVCLQAAGAERVVLILEEEGGAFVRASGLGSSDIVLERTALTRAEAIARTPVERVRASRQPLVIDDASHDPRTSADPYVASQGVKSLLALPVQRQGSLLSVLYFENNLMTHAFTASRLKVLELLSTEIAVSLENSLLFERLTREVHDRTRAEASVRFLANAGEELAQSLDFTETLRKLARLAVPLLGDWCVIDVVDENRRIRRTGGAHVDPEKYALIRELEAQTPDWTSPQPASVVLRTGSPLLLENLANGRMETFARDADNLRVVRGLGTRSAIAVPMVAHGRTVGVITCALGTPNRSYGVADLTVAQELARRAALALDNARLFRREQEAVRVREEFLSIAAHELNTPITSLSLMVQGLVSGRVPMTPDTIKTTLAVADRQVRRLARQIGELLDVSRIRAHGLVLKRSRVDLSTVAREVAERLRDEAGRAGSALRVDAEGPVVGHWDEARLEQVVTNLLSNAIKFGEGKPIDVSVRSVEHRALLRVHDEGIGIPPDRIPHIFERFERAVSAQRYGGLGLGLFIVKSIVDALGGAIAVDSRPGAGSTFIVELAGAE
ncbi:MAG: AAA family ATPase [Polyangiaceae bacterium]|nr:AAA family ATPase [Polyangiaceae bacterium]